MEFVKNELVTLRLKASKYDSVYSQNRELVTRKCGLETALAARDKEVDKMKDQISSLETQLQKE